MITYRGDAESARKTWRDSDTVNCPGCRAANRRSRCGWTQRRAQERTEGDLGNAGDGRLEREKTRLFEHPEEEQGRANRAKVEEESTASTQHGELRRVVLAQLPARGMFPGVGEERRYQPDRARTVDRVLDIWREKPTRRTRSRRTRYRKRESQNEAPRERQTSGRGRCKESKTECGEEICGE
jgi:hypothetical protein